MKVKTNVTDDPTVARFRGIASANSAGSNAAASDDEAIIFPLGTTRPASIIVSCAIKACINEVAASWHKISFSCCNQEWRERATLQRRWPVVDTLRFEVYSFWTALSQTGDREMPISLQLVDKEKDKDKAGKVAKVTKRPPPKEKEAFSKENGAPNDLPAPVGKDRRILVVDDNPVVLKAFELKLKSDGFIVTTTSNSAAVASTAEQTKAELIVLDVNFPAGGAMEWTGFTVMQWLHHFPEMAGLPVILISGSDSAEYKEKALAGGAIAFFQKPVVYKEILEVILKALPAIPKA